MPSPSPPSGGELDPLASEGGGPEGRGELSPTQWAICFSRSEKQRRGRAPALRYRFPSVGAGRGPSPTESGAVFRIFGELNVYLIFFRFFYSHFLVMISVIRNKISFSFFSSPFFPSQGPQVRLWVLRWEKFFYTKKSSRGGPTGDDVAIPRKPIGAGNDTVSETPGDRHVRLTPSSR